MGCTQCIKQKNRNIESNPLPPADFPKKQSSKKLKTNWTCPNCMSCFTSGTDMAKLNQHISTCITTADDGPESANIKIEERKTGKIIKNAASEKNQPKREHRQSFVFEKTPDDEKGIRYSWTKVKENNKKSDIKIQSLDAKQIKKCDFQTKQKWFRSQLQNLRINWENGCEYLKIEKLKLLSSAMTAFKSANLHKQTKIKFVNEQRTSDAGGLLRECVHLITKQIFDPQLKFFVRAETDELTYKLQACNRFDKQQGKKLGFLYGQIIGKAIFQKIPIQTYMDKTIIRQLCGQQIQLSDVFSYDKDFYNSWHYMLTNPLPKQSQTQGGQFYFTVVDQHPLTNAYFDHQLVKNGSKIAVTDQNKQQYITKSIKYMCEERVKQFIEKIKEGLYTVIPVYLLTVFQPHEFEMILYGVPFIDITNWKTNVQYRGAYHSHHKNICWFWAYIQAQDQDKLSKLLHFCTGTTRVPINGFKKLETNRGQYSRFVIQSVQYNEKDPYPKGHTCFNRLQLPVYPSKKLLQKYVGFILQANLEGVYGLE